MRIKHVIQESIALKQEILANDDFLRNINDCVELCVQAIQNGNKLLFCGNGGSASDAQHLAAELSARFYLDRSPIYAEALHVNTSYLTAISNDDDFNKAYERLVEAKAKEGDVLFAISTSGTSTNVLRAVQKAKDLNCKCIAFTGESGGDLKPIVDHCLCVPSNDTPRIQEAHIMIGHIICELIESKLFK